MKLGRDMKNLIITNKNFLELNKRRALNLTSLSGIFFLFYISRTNSLRSKTKGMKGVVGTDYKYYRNHIFSQGHLFK